MYKACVMTYPWPASPTYSSYSGVTREQRLSHGHIGREDGGALNLPVRPGHPQVRPCVYPIAELRVSWLIFSNSTRLENDKQSFTRVVSGPELKEVPAHERAPEVSSHVEVVMIIPHIFSIVSSASSKFVYLGPPFPSQDYRYIGMHIVTFISVALARWSGVFVGQAAHLQPCSVDGLLC